jgi:hypothetical protein
MADKGAGAGDKTNDPVNLEGNNSPGNWSWKKRQKKRAKSFGKIKTIITFAAPNKGNSSGRHERVRQEGKRNCR